MRKQYKIINEELGWEGDEVEGIPEEYNYEKIECFLQGMRDYTKFLKRGFGRTTHLTSIDIRNNRLDREEGLRLVEKYDGKKPASMNYFLELLGITEEKYMNLIQKHVISPNKIPNLNEIQTANKTPDDFNDFKELVKQFKKSNS